MEKKWEEKRRNRGVVIPLMYLLLEAVLLVLIVHIAKMLQIGWLVQTATLGAIAYFLFSCLPRFKRVVDRQKSASTLRPRRIYSHSPFAGG